MAERVAPRPGGRRWAAWSSTPCCTPTTPRCRTTLRKARAEEVVRATGLPWTVLRPAAYHQNLLGAALAGRIAVPYDLDAPFTNVDLGDVAEVAAEALTGALPAGGTHELAGPETLSVRALAEVATDVLGRPVHAEQVTLEDWATGPAAALPDQARADLTAMFRAYDAAVSWAGSDELTDAARPHPHQLGAGAARG